LAAKAGDGKAAYQLGVLSLSGDTRQAPDAAQAVRWWSLAEQAGHPLAVQRLADLYRDGAPGVPADAALAAGFYARASKFCGL
jgi:TPR repeat protein